MRHVHVAADALVSALFAPLCVSCHAVLDAPTQSPACDACWRNLRAFTPPLCDRCGEPLATAGGRHACAVSQSALTCCRAIGWYEDVLRDLIHAVEMRRAQDAGHRACAAVDPQCRRSDRRARCGARAAAPWRQWSRGFNQADDIARALPGTLRASRSCTLRRERHTRPPQSDLDAEAAVQRPRALSPLAGRRGRVAAAPVASRISMSCSLMM
jgi:predicted amidophosphoribosyltransferase